MTANRPSGLPTSSSQAAPPAGRRSARRERLSRGDSSRTPTRASTGGGTGGRKLVLLITGLFAIVAVVVIATAYIATQPKAVTDSPIAPRVVTPSGIPSAGRTLGNANAPVTLVVWEDFRCSFCFTFTMTAEPQLVTKFVETGKLKIVYQDSLTIDSIDGSTASRDAANAALCANDEGKFWPMHDWLFENQAPDESASAFSQDRLLAIGKGAGLTDAAFGSCVANGTHNAEIAGEGSAIPAGIGGTPGFVVNGKVLVVKKSFDEVAAAISAELAGSSAGPSASASFGPLPSAS